MLVPMPWHTFQSSVFPQTYPQPSPSAMPMAVLLCEGHQPVVNERGTCVRAELCVAGALPEASPQEEPDR